MNYSYLPKKIKTFSNIYDTTCIHCNTLNCFPLFNDVSCSVFHCPKCKTTFHSTKIIKTISSEYESYNNI
jgi:hypothetical protein